MVNQKPLTTNPKRSNHEMKRMLAFLIALIFIFAFTVMGNAPPGMASAGPPELSALVSPVVGLPGTDIVAAYKLLQTTAPSAQLTLDNKYISPRPAHDARYTAKRTDGIGVSPRGA